MVKTAANKSDNLNLPLYDLAGKLTGQLPMVKSWPKRKINKQAIAQSVRVYLINQRQGTVSTKTRGEVTGSTRKIYRQKGTGRARHGDIKAPIFVGGGIVGGPKPRQFAAKLNKKQKKQTLIDSLMLKIKSEQVIGLSDKFLQIKPQTQSFLREWGQLKLSGKKPILVLTNTHNSLYKAARNFSGLEICTINNINAYRLLNHDLVVFTQSAWDQINKTLFK